MPPTHLHLSCLLVVPAGCLKIGAVPAAAAASYQPAHRCCYYCLPAVLPLLAALLLCLGMLRAVRGQGESGAEAAVALVPASLLKKAAW